MPKVMHVGIKSSPPFSSLSWRGGFNPVFLLFCGAILAINWFVPASRIESNSIAMAYAELIRQKLLHISPYADIWAHARTTSFPNAALFSHALTWTLAVLIVIYDFLLVAFNRKPWTHFWRATVWAPAPRKTRVLLISLWFLVLAITWAATMMPGSVEHTASADLHSRVVLGFLSVLVFVMWHLSAFSYAVMFFAFSAHILGKDQS